MTVLSEFKQQKQTDRRCEKKVKFYYTSEDAKKLARATTYKVSFQHGYMFFLFVCDKKSKKSTMSEK